MKCLKEVISKNDLIISIFETGEEVLFAPTMDSTSTWTDLHVGIRMHHELHGMIFSDYRVAERNKFLPVLISSPTRRTCCPLT